MKFFLFFLFFSFSAFPREMPILNSSDPQFLWMNSLIKKNFSSFSKPLSQKKFKEAIKLHEEKGWYRGRLRHYRVSKNRVYGANGACKSMLEYLCSIYGLPDLQLFYLQDDGLHKKIQGGIPIFTGARAKGVGNSILFVDWYYDIALYQDWNLHIDLIDMHSPRSPWNSRIEKLFWRGSPTDTWSGGSYSPENWFTHSRGKACWLSQNHPDLIDARFVNILPFFIYPGSEEALKKVLPLGSPFSIEGHLFYKYQLQITGLMANFPRDRWQFYSNSVVFRHEPPHEMFWYDLIKPWEHYIPVETNLSDLVEKIEWARIHDDECRQIAARARQFMETHVMPEHIALYCYKALLKYASLFK